MEIEKFVQFFVKYSNIRFHENCSVILEFYEYRGMGERMNTVILIIAPQVCERTQKGTSARAVDAKWNYIVYLGKKTLLLLK
jgi:hypothetical protein